jgi:hypothetical protein
LRPGERSPQNDPEKNEYEEEQRQKYDSRRNNERGVVMKVVRKKRKTRLKAAAHANPPVFATSESEGIPEEP